MPVSNVATKASYAVAAACRLRPIWIEHAHADVGNSGWENQQKPIGADTKVAVAHSLRQLAPGFVLALDSGIQEVKEHEIVACAVHLGKLQCAASLQG
jgi:hypothetical protein